jgi:hypothetical protein
MKISGTLSLFLALLMPTAVMAQNCDAILVAGMRNVAVSNSSESTIAYKYYQNCGNESQWSDDSVLAKAEVEIFGEGKGDGKFTHEQRVANLHQWCVTAQDQAQAYKNTYAASDTIYSGSVQAWSACNKLKSKDVNFDPSITNDNRSVQMSISYSGNTVSGVRFYGIETEGFTCDVSAPPSVGAPSRGIEIGHEAISVTCKRKSPVSVKENGETYEKLERGVIAVKTAAYPFQLYFAPEYDPNLPTSAAKNITAKLAALETRVDTLSTKEGSDIGGSNTAIGGLNGRLNNVESEVGTLNSERVGNQVMILSVNTSCPPAWHRVAGAYLAMDTDIGTGRAIANSGSAWGAYNVWLCKKN